MPSRPVEGVRSRVGVATIAVFALAKLAVHLATTSGYGYFRDELYYLAGTEHLGAGYVDHPPLSIWALWIVRGLLGDSLLAVRLLPAILGAVTIALVGKMVGELGGGRWAGILAMTGALVAPIFLALHHVYSMNALDLFFWTLAGYLSILVIKNPSPRLWLLLGAVLGLGLLNKISVLWLGVGLLVGLLATIQRRQLLTPWPWASGGIAAAIFSPYLFWQIGHGWPTLEFIENATTNKMAEVSPLDFLSGQIEMVHPFTLPLWVGGLVFLLFHPVGKRYRLLGWVYLTVYLILGVSGSSRAYYLAPAYFFLFAAGGVLWEKLLDRPRLAWLRPAGVAILLLGGAIAAPLTLPILPIETFVPYARALGEAPSTAERKELGELGQFYADMHGWTSIVETVVAVRESLPESEREGARVFAPDYGVAGALDLFGRERGLAPAFSGHNSYWLWGPRDWDGGVTIVIGGRQEQLAALFEEVELAARTDCGLCMPYENHNPVWVCRGLRVPVAEAWAQVKHYD